MKSKHPLSWLFILLSVCWLLVYNQSAQAAPELTIGNYQLVSSKRITRTVFEYTYKAFVTNTGDDALGVSATLSINSSGVTVLDNQLDFGNVSNGASSTSSDTFSIRQADHIPLIQIHWFGIFNINKRNRKCLGIGRP